MKGKRIAKGQMARRLVYYCIGLSSAVVVWAVVVKTIVPTIDLSDILTFVSVTFGGELLLLMVKRVFAKSEEMEETSDE